MTQRGRQSMSFSGNCKFSMYHLSEDRTKPVCKRCESEKAAAEEAAKPGQPGDGSRWEEL